MLTITLSEALQAYTLLLMALVALLYLLAWLQDCRNAWTTSSHTLLYCRHCGNVSILKRQHVDQSCPRCEHDSQPLLQHYTTDNNESRPD